MGQNNTSSLLAVLPAGRQARCSLRKYWFIYSLYWQEGLQQRASFLMERFRSLVVLVSFYYFWSALLADRPSFIGYSRAQMFTYLLGTNVLRSLVFANRTSDITGDINHGRISTYLLKPISFFYYTFCRDLAEKSINLVSAIIEVAGLILFFHMPLTVPHEGLFWGAFLLSVINAVLIYFLMSFILGCWGFWTAESGGPRFLFELFLEFTAGAFFPLDVLPPALRHLFSCLPSPYLIFFPLNIILMKIDLHRIINGLLIQWSWILLFMFLAKYIWRKGLAIYSAEGS